tara:strand:- start:1330 stop:1974 length:645 start_codon:yes stop_codon:yes gene_type:complete
MNKLLKDLPKEIPVFPLSNFIIFPKTTVPLNIFEPRYIEMIDDAMKQNRMIGMIQPKKTNNNIPALYDIGCAGKITSFNETEDGRYLILLSGISRFKIVQELETKKLYRICKIDFEDFFNDLNEKNEEIKFSDLKLIFNNLKSFFIKQGYKINWKDLEKQNIDQTINTLVMASPFSLEEKQVLLEAINIYDRKEKLGQILSTYSFDNFDNKTLQ